MTAPSRPGASSSPVCGHSPVPSPAEPSGMHEVESGQSHELVFIGTGLRGALDGCLVGADETGPWQDLFAAWDVPCTEDHLTPSVTLRWSLGSPAGPGGSLAAEPRGDAVTRSDSCTPRIRRARGRTA